MKPTASSALIGLGIAAAVALAALAFQQTGAPATRRAVTADEQRYQAIGRIHRQLRSDLTLDRSMKRFKPLTAAIALDSLNWERWESESPKDPETGKPYPFRRIDDRTYELSVQFGLSSEEYARRSGDRVAEPLRGAAGTRTIRLRLKDRIPEW